MFIRDWRAPLVAAAALLYSAAFMPPQTREPRAEIEVVVVDDVGNGVPGAQVLLSGVTEPIHRVSEADAAGRVVFKALPAGTFTLAAESEGWLRTNFGLQGSADPVPIVLGESSQFNATITLRRSATIAGAVSDDKGSPAIADVRLLRFVSEDGARRLKLVAATRSSMDGVYQFARLPPGEYVLSARGLPLAEDVMPVPVFFGGSIEPAGAALVRVSPGQSVSGLDFRLGYQPAVRLRGLLVDSNGLPASSTLVHIVRSFDDAFGATAVRTASNGEFGATVIPGIYNLVVTGAGAMEVTVSAGLATADVIFPLGRLATLSGRLAFKDASVPPRLTPGLAVAELVPAPTASYSHLLQKIPVRVADASAMTFEAVRIPPGEYQVRPSAATPGWLPESMRVGDLDLMARGVTIRSGESAADVSLTLAAADAAIGGRMIDSQNAPVFDRKVLVFPPDPRDWTVGSARIRWAQPDTRGSFSIEGLPAGRYLLAVIAEAPADDWTVTLLESSAPQALPLVVEPGKRLEQNIRITGR